MDLKVPSSDKKEMQAVMPQGVVGPNAAGKMILRGMLMGSSEDWLWENSAIAGPLLNYLDNRQGEIGRITLNLESPDAPDAPDGPHNLPPQATKQEVHFFKKLIQELKKLERPSDSMQNENDVKLQTDEMIKLIRQRLFKYQKACHNASIKPNMLLIENAKVIMENITTRQFVTHQATETWDKKEKEPMSERLQILRQGGGPKQEYGKGEPLGGVDEDSLQAGADPPDPRKGYTPI